MIKAIITQEYLITTIIATLIIYGGYNGTLCIQN